MLIKNNFNINLCKQQLILSNLDYLTSNILYNLPISDPHNSLLFIAKFFYNKPREFLFDKIKEDSLKILYRLILLGVNDSQRLLIRIKSLAKILKEYPSPENLITTTFPGLIVFINNDFLKSLSTSTSDKLIKIKALSWLISICEQKSICIYKLKLFSIMKYLLTLLNEFEPNSDISRHIFMTWEIFVLKLEEFNNNQIFLDVICQINPFYEKYPNEVNKIYQLFFDTENSNFYLPIWLKSSDFLHFLCISSVIKNRKISLLDELTEINYYLSNREISICFYAFKYLERVLYNNKIVILKKYWE